MTTRKEWLPKLTMATIAPTRPAYTNARPHPGLEREGRQEVPPLGKQRLVTDGCWGREGQFAVSRAIPHIPHKSTQAAKIVFDRFFLLFLR